MLHYLAEYYTFHSFKIMSNQLFDTFVYIHLKKLPITLKKNTQGLVNKHPYL